MASAFGEHMLKSYNTSLLSRAPFGQSSQLDISTHGPMSFNPHMHGTFQSQPMFNDAQSAYQDVSDATIIKIHTLQAKLNQKLGPEYISQRAGPGGGKLTYAEGWKIINLANEVFGFNGWSSNVVNLTTDFIDYSEEARRFNVGVTAIVKVTLRDGTFHEDIGYGSLENSKTKGAALDKCKKEAVTDGLKRALRNFGNVMGNCLYDKSYTQEVIKMKVQPHKFNQTELHRRPEFEQPKPNPVPITSTSTPNKNPNVKSEPISRPISSIPAHMRTGAITMKTPNSKPSASHNTPPPPYNQNTSRPGPDTTSTNNMQPRPQPQVQPQTKPAPQKVEFSEPPRDPEESFSYSDDDAFLAAIDLGEVDMGRPIDFEEGTGGVSGASLSEAAAGDIEPPSNASGDKVTLVQAPQQQRKENTSLQNLDSSTTHAQHLASNSTSHLTSGPSNHRNQSTNQAQHPNPRQSSSKTAQERRAQAISDAISSDQVKTPIANHSMQEQKPHPQTNTNPSIPHSAATIKRAVAPSGAFNFPEGVSPTTTSPHPPQLPQRRPGQPSSSTAFSLKRPADAMNSHSSMSRRPIQGMGLAQQQTTAPSKREAFTPLELEEGGNVKRPRY